MSCLMGGDLYHLVAQRLDGKGRQHLLALAALLRSGKVDEVVYPLGRNQLPLVRLVARLSTKTENSDGTGNRAAG